MERKEVRGRGRRRVSDGKERARRRTFCTSPLSRSLLVLPLLLKPSASSSATSLSWSRSTLPSPYTCRTLHCESRSSPLSRIWLREPKHRVCHVASNCQRPGDWGATRAHRALRRASGTRATVWLSAADRAIALPDEFAIAARRAGLVWFV